MMKQIKKELKNQNKYKKYIKIFSNKQMKFLLSKLDLIFNKNNDINQLIQIEIYIMDNNDNIESWVNAITKLSIKWLNDYNSIDWTSFAKFLFYIYHYSEYYNKKSTLKNIYKEKDFITVNDDKKSYYDKWLISIYNNHNIDFNSYVIKVLELIK